MDPVGKIYFFRKLSTFPFYLNFTVLDVTSQHRKSFLLVMILGLSQDHNQEKHREGLCKYQRCNPLSLHSSFLPGNFHIRNGACMWRLNWLADLSTRGMGNSFGLMVNYRYVLEDVDKNNQQYLLNGTVAASPQFLQLL